jgi:hypothetical protein
MQRKTSAAVAENLENPRLAVVRRLLAMAELYRKQATIMDSADEALDWEKRLRARAQEIERSTLAHAA